MPIVGIKDCGGGPPRSGIPVRLPPQNICDVNPYVCRMTPASINFKDDPPYVGKLSFEPHPRGCQCCSKALQAEREDFQRSTRAIRHSASPNRMSRSPSAVRSVSGGFDANGVPIRHPSIVAQRETMNKRSVQEIQMQRQPQGKKKLSKSEKKEEKKRKQEEKRRSKEEKRRSKEEKKKSDEMRRRSTDPAKRAAEHQRVRLLREQKRRDDFVTACCKGLLLTPCHSAGSCSEGAEDREQANFYIQCKCCRAPENACEHQRRKKPKRHRAEFPCQCRNCKYQRPGMQGCVDPETGCFERGAGESPVCYCTDEEKAQDRQYRVCADDGRNMTSRDGSRMTQKSASYRRRRKGDDTVCDEMLPTNAALLTCNKPDGESCTKMVVTAELMQNMLIKQAQQGIRMANSLVTNKKFQLVDVMGPEGGHMDPTKSQHTQMEKPDGRSQPAQTSQMEWQRSQPVQTAHLEWTATQAIQLDPETTRSKFKSSQAVELSNDKNLQCYLENIDPPIFDRMSQNTLGEPLPRPPLHYQQDQYSNKPSDYEQGYNDLPYYPEDYANMDFAGGAQMPQPNESFRGSYQSKRGSGGTSRQPNESIRGSYQQSYQGPGSTTRPPNESIRGSYQTYQEPVGPTRQPNERIRGSYKSYQGPVGPTRPNESIRDIYQPEGIMGQPRDAAYSGKTGHICIPREALLQDPTSPKLCIPLSFDPRMPGGSADCPFASDHAQPARPNGESSFGAEQGVYKTDSQGLKQGSRQALREDSRQQLQGVQKEGSRQGLQKEGSRQGIQREGSRQGLQREGSGQGLQKEGSRQGSGRTHREDAGSLRNQDFGQRLKYSRDPSAIQPQGSQRSLRPGEKRLKPRRDSDRERRQRDPERSRRRSKDLPRPDRESIDSDDLPTSDKTYKRHRKKSASPCKDSGSLKRGDSTRKQRPSPNEMVKTLDEYESGLLNSMDKVKGRFLKKRGNETSSSKGSSLDSMTPGLAEFNCLLKHISCLRKELKKYSKDAPN